MKSWKKEIKEAFWAPPPKRKEAFLTEHLHEETSLWEFLISQAGCLSKSTWLSLAALFGLSLLLGGFAADCGKRNAVWMVSALLPFWSCLVTKELLRSRRFGMEELERSAPHSLVEVLLARLCFLGGAELLGLGVLSILLGGGSVGVEGSLYLLTPYFLTAFLTLHFLKRCDRENELWYCLLAGILVSALVILGGNQFPGIYLESELGYWGIALLLLLWGTGREVWKFLRQEGTLWSFN